MTPWVTQRECAPRGWPRPCGTSRTCPAAAEVAETPRDREVSHRPADASTLPYPARPGRRNQPGPSPRRCESRDALACGAELRGGREVGRARDIGGGRDV